MFTFKLSQEKLIQLDMLVSENNMYYCFLSINLSEGPLWSWLYGSWIYNYLCNRCLSPLMMWVRLPPRARSTTLYDQGCQWLTAGGVFSPGPPVSSTNKTDRHDITKILLKVALNTIKPTKKKINLWNRTIKWHQNDLLT
jgi:hypothetical protein